MATWSNLWTNLSSINSNNQFTNNDVPTADTFNKAINNIGYLKGVVDKKVSNWSNNPSNDNFPSEKLVKDNLDYLEDELDNLTTTVNSINNSYVKKVVGDTSITIDGGNIKLRYKYLTQTERYINVADDGIWVYDKDYASVLGDVNLCQKLSGYDDDIYDLQSTVQTMQGKFNGNNIEEYSVNENNITTKGLYCVNFYLSTDTTKKFTGLLNIYDTSLKISTFVLCSSYSSSTNITTTELIYNNGSITTDVKHGGYSTITATITACYKIAKIS